MNMSDEVTGATLQMATRVAESGMHMIDRTVDLIAKLLQMLIENQKKKPIKSTDLTDLKPGETKIHDLIASAKKNGDSISASEQGLTNTDKKYITKKAKEYGIPVAFTGSERKDNLYANVRTSDLPIFQRICTEMMKDKIAERPQELGNFKVQKWEMPFIISELNKHDLSAQFGKTKDGEYFCLYEKSDEKAIHIARNEFVRKCNEVEKEVTFDKDEKGYYILKDVHSGKEISFDKIPTRQELSDQIQEKFGYDVNKSSIVCAKFGEKYLQRLEKEQFFGDNPQREFSNIDTNIQVEGENVYAKEFSCWHVTPKTDHIPRIVFRSNETGKFAILTPENMTRKQMATVFREQMGLQDTKQINALIDKAEKVSDYYVREESSSLDYKFTKNDFDMTNPAIVSQMRRTDDEGNIFTKSVPINDVSNAVERTGKDSFSVSVSINSMETDQNGKEYKSSDEQVLRLSFSDKKDSLFQMTQLYRRQGISEHIAKQMAKEVFRMAETQNPEKVVLIEEVKEKSVILSHHDKKLEIDISEPEKAVAEISDKFDISQAHSEKLMEMVSEKFDIAKELSNLSEIENKTISDMQLKLPKRDLMQNQPSSSQEAVSPQQPQHGQNQRPFQQESVPPQQLQHGQNQRPFQQESIPQQQLQHGQNQRPFQQEIIPPEAYSTNVPEEPEWFRNQYDNAQVPEYIFPEAYSTDVSEEPEWFRKQYDNAQVPEYIPPEAYNITDIPEAPDWIREEYENTPTSDMPQNMPPVSPPSSMGGRR
ncbi:MAG: hypothetical protein HDT22_01800 [Ruminococcus sp.]|nr:hypothetical protein [Ruminococcus sp.]